MRQFPASPITALIDAKPRFNLGESCGRDLTLAEILTADELAALRAVPVGYGTSTGDEGLRHQIAARAGVPDSRVLVTAGAAGALFLLGLLFGDDEVVVGLPCYPPALDVVRGLAAHVRTVTSRFGDGYALDIDALRGVLSERTSLVMLASPQNPSATNIPPGDIARVLEQMAEVCPGAYLLIDETFREATYGGAVPEPSLAAVSPRIITCGSLSKAYGVPGLRIGWLTAPDPLIYEQLRIAKFNAAICCGSIDEYLAQRVLLHADDILSRRGQAMAQACQLIERWVASHSGRLRWMRPDAGAFCCVRLDDLASAGIDRFLADVAHGGTQIALGPWFGDEPSVIRIGHSYEPLAGLHDGLEVMTAALDSALPYPAVDSNPRSACGRVAEADK
jgi:aspartate/methionine/tyrosine aminotransferase